MSKRFSLVAVATVAMAGITYAGAAHSAPATCRAEDGKVTYVDPPGSSTHLVVSESGGDFKMSTGSSICTMPRNSGVWRIELYMGDGNDTVDVTAGDRTLMVVGGPGDDHINVNRTLGARVYGDDVDPAETDGNDTINAHGDVQVWAGGGNDVVTMSGPALYNEVHGGDGNDALTGGNETDRMWGDAGNDMIRGGGGRDIIYGGDGNDIIDGGGDADYWLSGGAGDDSAKVTPGDEVAKNVDGTFDIEHISGRTA